MIAYDEEGQSALAAVLQGVLDTAEAEGLIVMNHQVVIHEPTEEDRASRRLAVHVEWPPPYKVAEGREQELRDRLRAAILAALDPRDGA